MLDTSHADLFTCIETRRIVRGSLDASPTNHSWVLARLRACGLGFHFVVLIAALTLCFVASLTLPVLFTTLETVAVDTPAVSATFFMVTRPDC